VGGVVGSSGREEKVGKGHGSVIILKILCTHVCKRKKMIPVGTITGMGEGEDKGE
jgi:hypothetical protein